MQPPLAYYNRAFPSEGECYRDADGVERGEWEMAS